MTSTARRETGQASLEAVGLTVILAILLGAVAAWAVRAIPASLAPPPAVERAARPLAPAAPPPPRPHATRPSDAPAGGGPSVWRRLVRGGQDLLVFRVEMEKAFAVGFGLRVRDRALALVADPGALVPGPGDLVPDPVGSVRGAVEDARALRRYVAQLRRMPRREAILVATEDIGAVTADTLIDLGTRRLARRATRGGPRAPQDGGRTEPGTSAAPAAP